MKLTVCRARRSPYPQGTHTHTHTNTHTHIHTHCTVLGYTKLCCAVLYCTVLYRTAPYSLLYFHTHCTVLCCTVLSCPLQYCTRGCCAMLFQLLPFWYIYFLSPNSVCSFPSALHLPLTYSFHSFSSTRYLPLIHSFPLSTSSTFHRAKGRVSGRYYKPFSHHHWQPRMC